MRATEEQRFFAKVRKDASGCWLWTAYVDPKGYGRFKTPGECRAYRWSYSRFVGPIPDGLVIDHLCRVRHCVNPDHLRAVTVQENTFAPGSIAPAKVWGASSHCMQGHEFRPEDVHDGYRRCRVCTAERVKRARDAKRSPTCHEGHTKVLSANGKSYCPTCHSDARRKTFRDPTLFACGHERAVSGRINRRGFQYCGTCKEEITRARWARRAA